MNAGGPCLPGVDLSRLIPDCKVSVQGQPLEHGRDAQLTRVLVDLDQDLFGQCVLTFNDPKLVLMNDTAFFAAGVPVKVELGFSARLEKVFEGEVVALEPQFTGGRPPALRVVCQESLHRLALSQMTRTFAQADAKDVVEKIAQEHGYASDAPSGTKEHVVQGNLSDAAFLRRIGSVRLEGKKLVVGPPARTDDIEIVPGEGLQRMKVKLRSSSQLGEVSVHGWDAQAKREIAGSARPDGSEESAGAREHGKDAALRIAAGEQMPADIATAEAGAKARLRKLAERFITAKGEMIGDARILPGSTLALDKMGEMIDGRYRVEHARHELSRNGYQVKFSAVKIGKKKAAPAAKPVVAVQPAPPKKVEKKPARILNPRWTKEEHDHLETAKMQVDAQDAEDRKVNFLLEQHVGNDQWVEAAKAVGIVKNNQAVAESELKHPAHDDDPPDIEHASLLKDPRWTEKKVDDGEEVEMQVNAPGLDGREVRFVVERRTDAGAWEKAAEAIGRVEAGLAKAATKVMDLPPTLLKSPRWSSGDLAHGTEATMTGDAPGVADGTRVRFIVETLEPGSTDWNRSAEVTGTVKRGKASAKVHLEHPEGGKGADRKVRFRALVLPGEETPKPLANLRWLTKDLAHASEAVMEADAPGEPDGRGVKFVVETLIPGTSSWRRIAEVESTVKGGKVQARAAIEHPEKSGKEKDPGDRKLRFRAFLVPKPVTGVLRFRAELLHDSGPTQLRFRAKLAPEFEP